MEKRSGILNLAFTLLLCLFIFFQGGCDGGGSGGQSDGEPPALPTYQLYGLNFSPFEGSQDPNLGAVVSADQIERRMEIIAPYTEWIRTFGCTGGLEHAGRIAHSLQLKAAVGAWISADPAANEAELESLIREAGSGNVDLAIIGSEVLYRGDLGSADLISYIRRFRAQVPDVPVATADVYSSLLENPAVMAECDVILANFYPYWEGVDVNDAMAWLHERYELVRAVSGDKEVIVSETGWPSEGNTLGDAVPGPENAARFFKNFVSWARAEGVNYFYFESFDEPWKAAYEGPQGAHWGVWDEDGDLKPGMQPVFDGETMEDNWT